MLKTSSQLQPNENEYKDKFNACKVTILVHYSYSDLVIVICPGRADSGKQEVPSFRKICETLCYYLGNR